MSKTRQRVYSGHVLSKGIGFGKPIFLDSENVFEKNKILAKDVDKEILKFKRAIKKSKKQILEIKKSLSNDKLSITFDILNTHLEILNDTLITHEIINRIQRDKKSVDAVFNDIISEYKNKIKDPFFKEKVLDIADVFKRISSNIRSIKVDTVKNFNSKTIILSNEIIPSDVFEIDEMNISAFISFSGSYESHAAIIARSKNVPFISRIEVDKLKSVDFDDMIVDANLGKVIINPSAKTYEKYINLEKLSISQIDLTEKITLPKSSKLFANIANLKEVNTILEKNLSGIGLLRTEFLFLDLKNLPSQDEQYYVYKNIAQKLKGLPFIIRLFDLGGDKTFYNLPQIASSNFFGSRGINFLLKNRNILEEQIRAILKASEYGNIHILIPFVNDIQEIKVVKKLIAKIKEDLKISFAIKIGSMIETPAAVLMGESILKEVDFISIGTNDLTRYTLATKKIDQNKLHPALLKLIKMIINISSGDKKTIYICGEMLANKGFMKELIKLGLLNYSVGIRHIDQFKRND